MWEFKVLVFAPDHSHAGIRARLSFNGSTMIVQGRRILMAVDGRQVRLKAGGYDGRQWMLSWPSDQGEVSAMLQGETEIRLMGEYAPPELAAQLRQAAKTIRRRRSGFHLMAGTLALLLLAPVLLAGLFWVNSERIAGWVASHVSLDTEQRLGALTFSQLRSGLQLQSGGPLPAMIESIGGRLSAGSRYHYHWFVATSPEVNAYALPGGYVVVNTGLIKAAASPEEVAGVLAHEIEHVEQRHSLKNLIHGLGWRAMLSLALGDIAGGVWVDLAEHLGNLKYGRDLEREADLKGLERLRQAGIAAEGMASFFARLAARGDALPALLSSHPGSSERLAALQEATQALAGHDTLPLDYDWQEIRASLP